tara:strand:+ start:1029 stop:3191 length:2163 start_codon:yes stop_codon:yes gene_type:complete
MATLEEIQQKQANLKKNFVADTPANNSDVSLIGGTTSSALQGLTFGFSDEIGASVGALGSIFTDETFAEAFDRRVTNKRNDLEEFSKANPKLALGGEIAGSVAPFVASLLLTPFTGGASGTGAAASAARILSNPLLAGKVTKPGLNLLQRTVQGAKIGALQGGVAGAGYSEGGVGDRLIGGGIGSVAGTVAGGVLTPAIAGIGSGVRGTSRFVKSKISSATSKFSKTEQKSLRIIANEFENDQIPLENIASRIQENVDADKLIGISPVEILADYGGDAVNRKLRGIKTRVPGSAIEEKLIERTVGTVKQKADALKNLTSPKIQSERLLKDLELKTKSVIKTPNINLEGGIDDLSNTIDGYLSPLYVTAFEKNKKVTNIDLYKSLLKTDLMKNSYQDAITVYREKLISQGETPIRIPKLNDLFIKNFANEITSVTKYLPLEFLDLIKKSADQTTFQKIRDGSINRQSANSKKKIANNFRNLLKESTLGDEYETALDKAADKFSLNDAFEAGVMYHKPSTSAKIFNKQFNSLKTDIEKDAFKIGVFQQMYQDINKAGDSINLVKKIFESPDNRQKLTILFGDDIEARSQFVNRLVRESSIGRNTSLVLGGSNTAEKLFDAEEATQIASDLAVAGTAPLSSAGIRANASLTMKAKSYLENPLESTARRTGNILLEQNPTKQVEILNEVLRLQKQLKTNQEIEDVAINQSIRVGTQQIPKLYNE